MKKSRTKGQVTIGQMEKLIETMTGERKKMALKLLGALKNIEKTEKQFNALLKKHPEIATDLDNFLTDTSK